MDMLYKRVKNMDVMLGDGIKRLSRKERGKKTIAGKLIK